MRRKGFISLILIIALAISLLAPSITFAQGAGGAGGAGGAAADEGVKNGTIAAGVVAALAIAAGVASAGSGGGSSDGSTTSVHH